MMLACVLNSFFQGSEEVLIDTDSAEDGATYAQDKKPQKLFIARITSMDEPEMSPRANTSSQGTLLLKILTSDMRTSKRTHGSGESGLWMKIDIHPWFPSNTQSCQSVYSLLRCISMGVKLHLHRHAKSLPPCLGSSVSRQHLLHDHASLLLICQHVCSIEAPLNRALFLLSPTSLLLHLTVCM